MDTITQIFFYGLALGIVTLTITIFYLVNLYKDLVKKITLAKGTQEIKIKADLDEKTDKIVDAVTSEIQKKMEKQLMEIIANSKTNLDKDLRDIVEGIGKTLREEILSLEATTRRATEEEYDKTKLEIEAYKKEKLAEIDAKVKEILPLVLKDVIKGSIDVGREEELVINALEDAKRQNIL